MKTNVISLVLYKKFKDDGEPNAVQLATLTKEHIAIRALTHEPIDKKEAKLYLIHTDNNIRKVG